MQHGERYVSGFCSRETHGRSQVMYDLFRGEGTMGRGAILAGAESVGFDIARRPSTYGFKTMSRIGRKRYERELLKEMTYVQRDVMDNPFWAEMNNLGRIIH
eukprot:6194720-Pleurochrysis_carterae.AAC.3